MIDLDSHPVLKYPLFGSLYFSQGIIYALGVVILPVYFVEKGISLPVTTALIGVAYAPWVAKFIFGGITDYFYRYGRRTFIIVGGVISALGFFVVSFLDPAVALLPFGIVVFVASSGIVFLDVSADAWAIETTQVFERGKINAAMFGGLFLGMAITTAVIGQIAEIVSYPVALFVAGGIVLAIIVFPLSIKESSVVRRRQKIRKLLVKEFRKRPTQLVAALSGVSAISFGILSVGIPLFLKTVFDLGIGQIGLVMTIGPLSTVFGNVAGGFITDKWGRRNTMSVFFTFNIVFAAALVFAADWMLLFVLWGVIGFLHGGHYAVLGAVMMDVTNPKIGASQYSLLAGFANFGEMSGTTVTGSLIATLGFARVFLYAGWLYGPALLILYVLRLKSDE